MTADSQAIVDQRSSAYRTHLAIGQRVLTATHGPDEFMDDVEHQLAAWLRSKDLDLDVRHDNDLSDGERSVTVVHHEGGHGKRQIMATLVEETPVGVWQTELLGSSDGWVDLHVSNSEGNFASVPKLAKYLLEVLPIGDGDCTLSPEPRRIYPGDVSEVVDAVFDPTRRGLVFVCGTSDEHDLLNAFYERVPRWTREVYGLGQVFVLTPEATVAFNDTVGVFGTMPWTIRTYHPRVDREDLQDSRRHRYLTTASLARLGDGRIARLLGTIARTQASSREESTDVKKARRAFDRLETRRLSDAVLQETAESPITAEPSRVAVSRLRPEPEAQTESELLRLVTRVLGLGEVTEESLLQRLALERSSVRAAATAAAEGAAHRLEQQQIEIWRLEDESQAALDLLEDAAVDESDLRDRLEDLDAEVAWLRQRLQSEGDHEGARTPREGMDGLTLGGAPENLLEVVAHLAANELPHVVFCGAEEPVEQIVSADTLGNAARAAWDACRALNDYVRVVTAGQFSGSVEHFLKNLPNGCRGVPTKKHARGETETTMNQYGADRVFPVPEYVDESGKATMEAHFKLASIGMVSPRLYYLDRAQVDGKVYIGYIGKHLRNTQTN